MQCAGFLRGALVALALLSPARAQPPDDHAGRHERPAGELVFFLHGGAHRVSAAHRPIELSEDAALAADIVLAVTRDKFRLFGEYLASSRERDLERLQFGYEPVPETTVWVGRFHQPASAWNTEHHHGRYLQTSITRPSIELWEDEQGAIPQHLTGLLVDARPALGESAGLQLSFGVGIGPRIGSGGELDPFDLLDMHPKARRMSWSGRLAYLPDYVGATAFGVLAARHELPVVDAAVGAALGADRVRQNMYGAFADWRHEPWRVIAAAYDVYVELDRAVPRREHFLAGYVQVERQLTRGFTAYGRQESSGRAMRSTFLAVGHQSFDVRRTTLGLRSDLRPRMALTLELARGTTLQGRQNEYRLQWSAALP
jgi:hypothetical protein